MNQKQIRERTEQIERGLLANLKALVVEFFGAEIAAKIDPEVSVCWDEIFTAWLPKKCEKCGYELTYNEIHGEQWAFAHNCPHGPFKFADNPSDDFDSIDQSGESKTRIKKAKALLCGWAGTHGAPLAYEQELVYKTIELGRARKSIPSN